MDMPVIYIDVLFAVNFIINYVLLKTSCIFINLKHSRLRMMLGALIGSIYAILIFFPDFVELRPILGYDSLAPLWRADREAEGARLLSEYTPQGYPGFESPALRHGLSRRPVGRRFFLHKARR